MFLYYKSVFLISVLLQKCIESLLVSVSSRKLNKYNPTRCIDYKYYCTHVETNRKPRLAFKDGRQSRKFGSENKLDKSDVRNTTLQGEKQNLHCT